MGIYRRPDSRWWWLYVQHAGLPPVRQATRIPVQGATPEQTASFRKLAELTYYARLEEIAKVALGLIPAPKPTRTWTAQAAWYLEHISPTKRNLARERSMLKQLTRHLGVTPLADITRDQLIEWRGARLAEVKARTVNREIDLLRHVLASAMPTYLDTNPAAGLKDAHAEDVDIRILEWDDEVRLLAALETAEDRALVLCALDTLMRLTTVALLLRSRDKGTYLEVLNAKTARYKVPVSPRLRVALDALPTTGPHYFPTYAYRAGQGVTVQAAAVQRMFYAACERAGVPHGRDRGGVTFHGLRHTGASRMLAAGVDVEVVRQIGGWSNLRVLQRYLHPTDTQRRTAVAVIGDPSRFVHGLP